ncbi:hypothetical protein VTH06DRAFT_3223 [Thermothelomyces fergusii]
MGSASRSAGSPEILLTGNCEVPQQVVYPAARPRPEVQQQFSNAGRFIAAVKLKQQQQQQQKDSTGAVATVTADTDSIPHLAML